MFVFLVKDTRNMKSITMKLVDVVVVVYVLKILVITAFFGFLDKKCVVFVVFSCIRVVYSEYGLGQISLSCERRITTFMDI